jgi:hypothetical protein
MNFEQIKSMWRSPHNQPSATELEQHKMKLVTELKRRHRASRGLLGITALPLLFITYKITRHFLSPDPTHTPVDWEREWAVLPFLVLPWLGWFVMLRLYLRHQRRHPDYEGSIRASVAASLDENRTERIRYGVLAGMLFASIPLLMVVVHQLRAVGKAGDEILLPAFVIWPAYVAMLVPWFGWHYFRRLLPRKRQLEELAQSYK